MAVKNKVTLSLGPAAQRPSPAERRAAQIETLSTQQAELKREAAERRRKRDASSEESTPAHPEKTARPGNVG